MASARSKRTYIIGWDGCCSLPFRNGRRITAGRDRHFKTNHRLACPISVLSPRDRQILQTASLKLAQGKFTFGQGICRENTTNLKIKIQCGSGICILINMRK